jgi:hypothetical protein
MHHVIVGCVWVVRDYPHSYRIRQAFSMSVLKPFFLPCAVCGSQAIASATRAALRFPVSSPANVLRGGPSVTLHVESFGYA